MKKEMKKEICTPLDKAVRAVWVRALKKLPLEMAIERKYHEITAAMIKDEGLRSLFVPKWLIGKRRHKEIIRREKDEFYTVKHKVAKRKEK